MRQRAQVGGERHYCRQQHGAPRFGEHQPVGEVVDVLRSACEVDELGRPRDLGRRCKALLQPVLDRLDVVIGGPFDRLDALGIGDTEFCRGGVEQRARGRGERRYFGDSRFSRERREPDQLDLYPVADEAVLAEVLGESRHLVAVAPIERV